MSGVLFFARMDADQILSTMVMFKTGLMNIEREFNSKKRSYPQKTV